MCTETHPKTTNKVNMRRELLKWNHLTHWGRVTHICVGDLTIIGSDNGLSSGRHQAIIWTNAGILIIRTLGTNFSEIVSEIHTFLFTKMHLKMSSVKWRPFCLGVNVLTHIRYSNVFIYILLRRRLQSFVRSWVNHIGLNKYRQYSLEKVRIASIRNGDN